MAAPDSAGAAEDLGGSKKTRETLSQFVARVLDQLSLSAWLPSAALVLLVAFVVQLGAVLDAQSPPPPRGPVAAIGQALGAIAKMKLGGALLLVAAVVVLTIVTQAFSFEAIRTLEGYWGTSRVVEWVASRRCDHYRKVCDKLQSRMTALTEAAWCGAACEIERRQQDALEHGGSVEITPDMISVLGARARGRMPIVTLTKKEEAGIGDIDWHEYASPELIRRRQNVDNRFRDFPELRRMLPTRLGNVLRHHEAETGRESVESLVQEVFDVLPLSLRIEHDEQRTRLDLYCSMTFVIALIALIAAARFAARHWTYSVGAIIVGAVGVALMYRAALASARAYGRLLLLIAKYAPEPPSGGARSACRRCARLWQRRRKGGPPAA
jgi:hypothetical protein